MDSSNRKKYEQLGMPLGTASNKLRKQILFSLVQETGKDFCFQCGETIKSIDNFSIEHKIPYLDSDDPVGLFFDPENISFSHLKCNVRAARSNSKCGPQSEHGTRSRYGYGCRCSLCRKAQADYQREYMKRRNNTKY